MRILIDVDGVVADLMAGFEKFIHYNFGYLGLGLNPKLITTFHISKSPAHQELHRQIDLDAQIIHFLSQTNIYNKFVDLIPGSQEGISALLSAGHDLAFVTATMHESPESYVTKYRWLNKHFGFGHIPVISCPSKQKCWVTGDYGIDDRFDTCESWRLANVKPLLFRQPWNEAPVGTVAYDWQGIVHELTNC